MKPRAPTQTVRRALRLREQQGWRLLDIAVEVGVSEASVSRWCRGLTRREVTGGPNDATQSARQQEGTLGAELDGRGEAGRQACIRAEVR
jgi:transcriptional regulator with XRE-family HTH domain